MVRLKNNKYAQTPQASLDLHGFILDEAQEEVVDFLTEAKNKNYRLIRIITGKGIGSVNGHPVLKPWLEGYLSNHGYRWRLAKINEGGAGALDISL
ncbi:hypothetical protein COT94_02460 [Candidatus Falkowbacteria bacterium CG10_big_fil_rev_8_21_14_0_10_37_14]|uniref:Smr domain-containing protein n=1 Tax=Candidatus Falkowbacteria bacterium CG10_big_fil_rev_8_21_14_0_10_37_14 TaxID=1974561 RepID=A0A2M6WTG7_9BACT|nr:Smr/MutS family protein [Candidatus Falkowbacteria bacterium]PIT96099.1 MAG: hypothetical protein COT94_02460 [Candidatus Falkowbacteria bacterium CG10_big_fil_rev_8_21_14_0_10_37_14]